MISDAAPFTLETIPDLNPDPARTVPSTGCDFGDTGYNPDDVAVTCNNKLIGAGDMRVLYEQFIGSETYATARDYDGTTPTPPAPPPATPMSRHRSSAGTSARSPASPRDAQVVAYSACGNLGCFGGDLALAIDTAAADGVDVINYSIGSDTPGLIGADDIAFLFAADVGVFVSTSAGNAGPGAGTVGAPASVPWVTTVGASLQKKTYIAEVRTGDAELTGGHAGSSGTPAGTKAPRSHPAPMDSSPSSTPPTMAMSCVIRRSHSPGTSPGRSCSVSVVDRQESRRAQPWPTPVGPAWSSTTSTTSRTCSPTTT